MYDAQVRKHQAISLCDISHGMSKVSLLRAIIISKGDVKRRKAPKSKTNDTSDDQTDQQPIQNVRAGFSITIRDLSGTWINCTVEACAQRLLAVFDELHIGDTIIGRNLSVQQKCSSKAYVEYNPDTASDAHLIADLDLDSVDIEVINNENGADEMMSLLNVPTKDCNDYYSLSDLTMDTKEMSDNDGKILNILACVKRVGKVSEITTKYGSIVKKREIKVFDTTSPLFHVNLWGDENSFIADFWTPQETILFLSDVRLAYDKYKNQVTCSTTSKTVITQNPDTQQGKALHNFAKKIQGRINNFDDENEEKDLTETKESTIENVTISQLKHLIKTANADLESSTSCTTYAYISILNIDAENGNSVSKVCSICKKRVDNTTAGCTNFDCVQSSLTGNRDSDTTFFYRYTVNCTISDHTGSLENCSITNKALENIITYPAEQFKNLDTDQRCMIKSDLTFEMMKILIKIEPVIVRKGVLTKILKCELTTGKDYLENSAKK